MSLLYSNPEKWYATYEPASKKQRYEMLLETLEQSLSDDFIQEIELGMSLLETMDDLLNNNLIQELLDLIHKIQTKQPGFYDEEFFYYDRFLINYALFCNEPHKAEAALASFIKNPIDSIDYMLPLSGQLRYYGATDLAVTLARKTYKKVKTSSELLGGSEYELVNTLFLTLVSDVYAQLKKGEQVDWDSFLATAKKYDFTGGQRMIDEIRHYLTAGMDCDDQFVSAFKKKKTRTDLIMALSWEFGRYMLDEKQMAFMCSESIWAMMLSFWEEGKGSRKGLTKPDSYFNFSQKNLEQYLIDMLGGFLSTQQNTAVAMLWGIPYIYDFLLAKTMIPESVHQDACDHVAALKPDVINGFGNSLWKYDFVHRWTRPDSISEEEFQAEADLFRASIKDVRPLTEKPYNQMDRLREMFGDM